jgi:hypothetical protein
VLNNAFSWANQVNLICRVIIPRHNYAATAASFFVREAILWNDLLGNERGEKFNEKCGRSWSRQKTTYFFFTFEVI